MGRSGGRSGGGGGGSSGGRSGGSSGRSSGGYRSGGSGSSRSSSGSSRSSSSTSRSSSNTSRTSSSSGSGFGGGFSTGLGFGMGQQVGRNIMGGGNNNRNRGFNNNNRRHNNRGRQKAGCGVEVVVIIIFIVIALMIMGDSMGGTAGMSVDRSTVERTAIRSTAPGDSLVYFDDTGDNWFTNARAMENGAREAYRLTGVKFGIWVANDINGNYNPSDAVLDEFANALYEVLFEDSRDHFLLVLIDLGNEYFAARHVIGGSALTVFDPEAIDIFYGYLDYYWHAGSARYSESEMFGHTLQKTAERIMSVTPSALSVIMPWIFGLTVIIIVFVGINAAIKSNTKRKLAAAEQDRAAAELLNTPIAGLDTNPTDPLLDKYKE